MALNEKQKKFCEEYLKDLNGTRAAIRAGYSKRTANEQAAQLLAKLSVKEYLEKGKQRLREKNEDLAQRVIDELKKLAFSNIKNLVNGGNMPLELKALPDDVTAAVSSVSVETKEFQGVTTINSKLKIHSKDGALDKLAKHLGLYEIDNKQKQTTNVIDLSGLNIADLEKLAGQ